jgi:hypothetical protein
VVVFFTAGSFFFLSFASRQFKEMKNMINAVKTVFITGLIIFKNPFRFNVFVISMIIFYSYFKFNSLSDFMNSSPRPPSLNDKRRGSNMFIISLLAPSLILKGRGWGWVQVTLN